MTSAVILGMIVTMFTEARERTRAISLYSFVASAGASIGLLAGGVLTATLNWHWIFFVNLPIGIVTAILALPPARGRRGPRSRPGRRRPRRDPRDRRLMLGVLHDHPDERRRLDVDRDARRRRRGDRGPRRVRHPRGADGQPAAAAADLSVADGRRRQRRHAAARRRRSSGRSSSAASSSSRCSASTPSASAWASCRSA